MEIENLLTLIDKVSASELTEFSFEEGNLKVSMGKKRKNVIVTASEEKLQESLHEVQNSGFAAGSVQMAEAASSHENEGEGKIIKAPLVGTFYTSSSPDAVPFVEPGDTVKKGQVLGIIEAMKLMNEIESEFDGIVEEVLAQNEEVVEYGQPLFKIR